MCVSRAENRAENRIENRAARTEITERLKRAERVQGEKEKED